MTKISLKVDKFEGALNHASHEEEVLKFLRAVEQSASVIMITNIKGDIEYVNPKFSEVTGYKKEKVISQQAFSK